MEHKIAEPPSNVQTQIVTFREVIASNSPDALKYYDLSWLLHLIGDVHQPRHCTTRVGATQQEGDDGGNGVKLTSPPPANLHAFWDDVLGVSHVPSVAASAAAICRPHSLLPQMTWT